MRARIALIAPIVAATLFITAACASANSSADPLPPGVVIVPPAWAGVWDIYEETVSGTTFECLQGSVTTRSYRDTLCAGDTIQVFPSPYPAPAGCYPGTGFTDTTLKVDCHGWWACHACCNNGGQSFIENWDANWSLAGDVATTTVTYQQELYGAPPCTTIDSCMKTTGTRTRVWPESNICGAPLSVTGNWPAGPAVRLLPMRPNPATAPLRFRFELSRAVSVRFEVFDLFGRRVSSIEGRDFDAGPHDVEWNGRTSSGAQLGPGVYVAVLRAGDVRDAQRFVLTR